MRLTRTLTGAGKIVLIGAVTALIFGSVLGQPILLSYVETGSMEPTLDPGDGFVAVPTQIAGPVEEGDVVVFQAEEVNGGRLTTHRVVEETDRGFITKGDANPFTDQANGDPPVKPAQVEAVALQVNGQVVVIPELGTVVTGIDNVLSTLQRQLALLFGTGMFLGTQGLAYLIFAGSLVWYAIAAYRDRTTKSRLHDRTHDRETGLDVRVIMAGFAALLVLGTTASMAVPAGTQEYGVVSAEFDSPGAGVIPTGASESTTYPVANGGTLPVVVFLEPASDGVAVQPREVRVGAGEVVNATITLSAPPETGYYRRYVAQHRYLAILPQGHIRALYEVHPWLPVVVIDALVAVPFYLLGVGLVGTGRVRRREGRDLPVTTRARRSLGQLWR